MYVLGVVLFALGIGVSIALHEAGHLVTAKRFGMKATKYFIGFGPTVFSFQRGETEYGLKALPLGGFVKVVGHDPSEEIAPEDASRAYFTRKTWQKAIFISAGSLVHFIIGILILYGVILASGTYTTSNKTIFVSPCVNPAGASCGPGDPVSPAKAAGLRDGDQIVSFAGQPVGTYDQSFADRVRSQGPGPVAVTVLRNGQTIPLTVDLARKAPPAGTAPPAQAQGVIGVGPEQVHHTFSAASAVPQAFGQVGSIFKATGLALYHLPSRVTPIFSALAGGKRDPNGLISIVGASRLGGEAAQAGQVATGWALLASLNIFIGVFNLLPLLPLDGGHLAVVLYEAVRRRVAAFRGRRDPGRVDLMKLLPATYAVFAVVAVVSALTVVADFINPVANPFR